MTAPGPISYADRAPTRIAPSDWASKSSEGARRASPTSSDAYGETAYPIQASSCVDRIRRLTVRVARGRARPARDAYGETAYPIQASSCVALTPARALLPFA